MQRISVIANNGLVPLFSSDPVRDSRFCPWKGLLLEVHDLGPIEVPEHEHSSVCLHMHTTGPMEVEWWADGKPGRKTANAGSLILLSAGTRDAVRFGRASRHLLVSMEESLLHEAAAELEIAAPVCVKTQWGFENDQLRLLLSEIEREMLTNASMGKLYGDMLGMALALTVVKNHCTSNKLLQFAKGGLTNAKLNRVINYMHEYCRRDLRLSQLADVAQTSVYHFSRLFHQSVGMPPHQYLTHIRIDKAKVLLRVPKFNMTEIASETGFANSSHFGKSFRRVVGVTPSEYKELCSY
jgi:AraC family transcriptional regulator